MDFPGAPVVQTLPSNAGDMGSIPGQGTKIPHSVEPLSLGAITRETQGLQRKIPRATTKTSMQLNT